MQLGILEARNLIHKKGTIEPFNKGFAWNNIFHIYKWKKYCGHFLDLITSKFNDNYKQIL